MPRRRTLLVHLNPGDPRDQAVLTWLEGSKAQTGHSASRILREALRQISADGPGPAIAGCNFDADALLTLRGVVEAAVHNAVSQHSFNLTDNTTDDDDPEDDGLDELALGLLE